MLQSLAFPLLPIGIFFSFPATSSYFSKRSFSPSDYCFMYMQIQDLSPLSLWIFTRTFILNIMHHITPPDFDFAITSTTWWDNPAPFVTAIGFCSAISYELAICILLLPITVQFGVRWRYWIFQVFREEATTAVHNGGCPAAHVGEHTCTTEHGNDWRQVSQKHFHPSLLW